MLIALLELQVLLRHAMVMGSGFHRQQVYYIQLLWPNTELRCHNMWVFFRHPFLPGVRIVHW